MVNSITEITETTAKLCKVHITSDDARFNSMVQGSAKFKAAPLGTSFNNVNVNIPDTVALPTIYANPGLLSHSIATLRIPQGSVCIWVSMFL